MLLHCRVYLWSSNFFMKLLKADFDMYTSLTLTANVSTIHFTDSTFANRTWFRIMPMTVRSDHIWYSVNLRYRQCCCGCGFDQSAEQDAYNLMLIQFLFLGFPSWYAVKAPAIYKCDVQSIFNKWPVPFFTVDAWPVIWQCSISKVHSAHATVVVYINGGLFYIDIALSFLPCFDLSKWQQSISIASNRYYCISTLSADDLWSFTPLSRYLFSSCCWLELRYICQFYHSAWFQLLENPFHPVASATCSCWRNCQKTKQKKKLWSWRLLHIARALFMTHDPSVSSVFSIGFPS